MLKKLVLASSLLFTLQVAATDPHSNCFQSPEFKKELYERLMAHVQQHRQNPITQGTTSAINAAKAPWTATASAGFTMAKELNINDEEDAKCVSVATQVVLSPFATAASGGLFFYTGATNFVDSLCQRITAKFNEKGFMREMTLKLYQWIDHIKKGREEMRGKIQAMQAQQKGKSSVKDTAQEMLKNEGFKYYFGDTGFSTTDFNSLMTQVHPSQDNWQGFFPCISNKLKSATNFTESQWQTLQNGLVNYKGDRTGFPVPAVTKEDIQEYLYVAVYFFTLPEGHMELLTEYVNYLATGRF
ncbi:MAG TPA: hypothetical protein VEL47_00500 [Myxococcota bacterium]|nr:hypothetical protein [Myxococcota bacterium]